MKKLLVRIILLSALCGLSTQCGSSLLGSANMGGPTQEERTAKVANEPVGDFYYGRRYFVEKTRFWGYVRKPRQPWNRAKLVIFREDQKHSADRLPENGPTGRRYAFDQNFEYRLRGHFTGSKAYEPNSNQFLDEFMLTGYELVDPNPGWLFRPSDRYDRLRVTLTPP